MRPEPHLSDFEHATQNLDDLGVSLTRLISELLRSAGLQTHSIDYRVKSKESANRKVAKGQAKYAGLTDLTDLLGIRIITYFATEVDQVADALWPHLAIDEENSIDKRKSLPPDRFGYLSLHYVAQLGSDRQNLVEYARFKGKKFEIQIRSILQHAWAEIEHDLGYKANDTLPQEMRRRFSRLAGLLEIADDEFVSIRQSLIDIEQRVSKQITDDETAPAQSSGRMPLNPVIDQSSIRAVLRTRFVHELDHDVAKQVGLTLDQKPDPKFISRSIVELRRVGVHRLDELLDSLTMYSRYIVELAGSLYSSEIGLWGYDTVPQGTSLRYLALCLAGSQELDALSELEAGPLSEVTVAWQRAVEKLGPPSMETFASLKQSRKGRWVQPKTGD
ncbi:GTP pyrophosphokinase [Nocardia salmonicida]|uniref:GTP pyrophosphokinase n=1 Tax=Nocardia salmonicida TaxID=53431 RepID=UPI0033D13E46